MMMRVVDITLIIGPAGKASFVYMQLNADDSNGSIQWKMTH